MRDNSQCQESTWILENLHPPIGTFAEVGAFDGIQSSNTLLFEDLGWTGVLVEADPFLANKCRINRPNCRVWDCAAGAQFFRSFYINTADRGLSGFNRPGNPLKTITMRLEWLLGYEAPDLLSIDTEGTELEVWASIGDLRPNIVIMEYQTCDEPPQDKAIVERMTLDGYQEVHRTKYNLIFTKK